MTSPASALASAKPKPAAKPAASSRVKAAMKPETYTKEDVQEYKGSWKLRAEARAAAAIARTEAANIKTEQAKKLMEEKEAEREFNDLIADGFAEIVADPWVDPQWCVSRFALVGHSAAKRGDLATVRSVLGDLMKHAKEAASLKGDTKEDLVQALVQLGPEAVADAAKRLGLEVQAGAGSRLMKDLMQGRVPALRKEGDPPPPPRRETSRSVPPVTSPRAPLPQRRADPVPVEPEDLLDRDDDVAQEVRELRGKRGQLDGEDEEQEGGEASESKASRKPPSPYPMGRAGSSAITSAVSSLFPNRRRTP